jgi:hypothetical protein
MSSYYVSTTRAAVRIARQAALQGMSYSQALSLLKSQGYGDTARCLTQFDSVNDWNTYLCRVRTGVA